jgi:hypothetical protein
MDYPSDSLQIEHIYVSKLCLAILWDQTQPACHVSSNNAMAKWLKFQIHITLLIRQAYITN